MGEEPTIAFAPPEPKTPEAGAKPDSPEEATLRTRIDALTIRPLDDINTAHPAVLRAAERLGWQFEAPPADPTTDRRQTFARSTDHPPVYGQLLVEAEPVTLRIDERRRQRHAHPRPRGRGRRLGTCAVSAPLSQGRPPRAAPGHRICDSERDAN